VLALCKVGNHNQTQAGTEFGEEWILTNLCVTLNDVLFILKVNPARCEMVDRAVVFQRVLAELCGRAFLLGAPQDVVVVSQGGVVVVEYEVLGVGSALHLDGGIRSLACCALLALVDAPGEHRTFLARGSRGCARFGSLVGLELG